MTYELITSYRNYEQSLTELLKRATRSLCIFDEDLQKLKLERPENTEILREFLVSDAHHTVEIIVQNAEPLRRHLPRLMSLLVSHSRNLTIVSCASHLLSLSDSIVIADERHALIRFHKDNARSKMLTETAEECAPYVTRFSDIRREGGEQICATTLGL